MCWIRKQEVEVLLKVWTKIHLEDFIFFQLTAFSPVLQIIPVRITGPLFCRQTNIYERANLNIPVDAILKIDFV